MTTLLILVMDELFNFKLNWLFGALFYFYKVIKSNYLENLRTDYKTNFI